MLAGRQRPALRAEWRAHLAGETATTGYLAEGQAGSRVRRAPIRYRLRTPPPGMASSDAVLGSRTLSNMFVGGPVIVTLVAIVRHDGRFGLVADDQDPVALGAFLYVVIKTGRWWRGVKPPEPRARRARE